MSYSKERITKAKARKLFNNGTIIYLKQSKVSMQALDYSQWLTWCDIRKDTNHETPCTFDQAVNNFYYYNCNDELGNCVHYYYYPEID